MPEQEEEIPLNCEHCGTELQEGLCPNCGAEYLPVCLRCQAQVPRGSSACPVCGGEVLPGWNASLEVLEREGIHAFLPYRGERIYDIYLGGNPDGGGYAFHNDPGYTGPVRERIVLPGLAEGRPIYGIWNEFFCVGDEFTPDRYDETFRRMLPLKTIIVSNGIREAFTYAFFGCCGLETLVLPRTLRKMFYDFYDLFIDGSAPMQNGFRKTDVTVRYRGSREEWERVIRTSRFDRYVEMGRIRMEYGIP